jgi:hypothetical protein
VIKMSAILKEKIPAAIVSAIFVLFVMQFFFEVPQLATINTEINGIGAIIAAFAIILSTLNIAIVYGTRIIKRTKNWEYSVLLIITLVVTVVSGLMEGEKGTVFQWIYLNINYPIGATIFSLLGFYIVSAAYRAFRAKTWEAAVLLIFGAVLIMWGAPIFHLYVPGLNTIGSWMLDVPNVAGFRGYMIGVAIAAVTIGVSTFLHKTSAFESTKSGAGGE